jgi:hypothetical protein
VEIERLIALIDDWQLHVVRPLRGVRRFLKEPGQIWSSQEVAFLRQRLKEEELLAERLQQTAMEAAFPNPGAADDLAAAKANCELMPDSEVEFPWQRVDNIGLSESRATALHIFF